MYMCIYIRTYLHSYIQIYIHTYIHTYFTHTYMHSSIHTYIHTYIHTNTPIHTYIHVYIHTHTCIRTYMHTHIHTYTHTNIHTHVYVFACIYRQILAIGPTRDRKTKTVRQSHGNLSLLAQYAAKPLLSFITDTYILWVLKYPAVFNDCFYNHSWRNNVVIAFETLSSFLTQLQWVALFALFVILQMMKKLKNILVDLALLVWGPALLSTHPPLPPWTPPPSLFLFFSFFSFLPPCPFIFVFLFPHFLFVLSFFLLWE